MSNDAKPEIEKTETKDNVQPKNGANDSIHNTTTNEQPDRNISGNRESHSDNSGQTETEKPEPMNEKRKEYMKQYMKGYRKKYKAKLETETKDKPEKVNVVKKSKPKKVNKEEKIEEKPVKRKHSGSALIIGFIALTLTFVVIYMFFIKKGEGGNTVSGFNPDGTKIVR